MDRIEFEEWSLKAIDPALAPQTRASMANDSSEKANAKGEMTAGARVCDCIFTLIGSLWS